MILNNTFFKYTAVGIFNTAVGLTVIWFAKYALEINDVTANMIGYAIGIGVSFTLNRKWTFRHGKVEAATFLKFLFVLLAAYLANLSTLLISIKILGMNGYYAQLISVIPYTIVGYLGNKYFTFRIEPNSVHQ